MRVRTFVVPFAKIVGEDAHELDFGPDDHVVVRPLFGLSKAEIEAWAARIADVEALGKGEDKPAAEAAADQLVLDLLNAAILEWVLDGPDGAIAKPTTPEALNALPGALAGSLYRFLTTYRGEAVGNPTKRS
jgi:hypothetical protein